MKLSLKISWLLAAVMAAVLMLFEVAVLLRESELLEEEVRGDTVLVAQTVASLAAHADPGRLPAGDMAALLQEVTADEQEVIIAWRRLDGSDAPQLTAASLARLQAGQSVVIEVLGATGSSMVAWAPVRSSDGGVQGLVEVTDSLAGRDAFMRRGLWTAVAAVLFVTLLTGLASLVAGRALVGRRVDLLVEKTRQVARGDLSQPVVMGGNDELSALAQALERMSSDLARLRRLAAEEARARLEAEVALQHADRLRTVGVLAAGVAHELGTPLNVISGRASLLERRGGADPKVASDAAVIHQQADRIARIVRLMLDFSRRSEPRARRCDLGDLARDGIELLASPAHQKGVQVVAEVPPGGVPAVVDREQISHVVTNLVLNAIQASPPDGRVTVSVAPAADGGARMCISDQGTGVPEAEREHIFEPFFTTKAPGDGTGLGLSIVRRILEDHGGSVHVEEATGGGACFVVQVPPREEL